MAAQPSKQQPVTGPTTRMDAHVHSKASDKPVVAAAGVIGCPESYSEPEAIYDMARNRGMDLVTITDHDTVRGAMELVERGFQGFIAGEEVTTHFPEDRCKLHVLIWGMTPELDEEIEKEDLRDDVYQLAAWIKERDLAHALAHPLYIQNGRLTRWHVERAALLFKAFENLNGAHQGRAKHTIERFLGAFDERKAERLSREHELDPLYDQIWDKGATAGSDDHALLNVGRTYTQIIGEKIVDAGQFVHRAMNGESTAEGVGGHASLLAHQITAVGARHYAETWHKKSSPTGKLVASKLLKFAGVRAEKPKKSRLAAHVIRKRVVSVRRRKRPLIRAIRKTLRPTLDRHPELQRKLDPELWLTEGMPLADHGAMAEFIDDMIEAVTEALSEPTMRAWRRRDRRALAQTLTAYGAAQLAQLPYIFSLFHQNKERVFLERLEHELSAEDGRPAVLDRPMRVSLFTDTLGDVNGVCRFIQNVAERALDSGRDLQVITSTRLEVPDAPNIFNFKPVFAGSMPKYENLEAVLPPITRMLRHLDEHQPDVLHISTPGPVGFVGYLAARMLKIPVLGVYHTDFPAYIEHLFEDHALTYICKRYMKFFYAPFWKIFTRSEDYIDSLDALGLDRDRCCRLLPGCDVELFNVRHKDMSVWDTVGLSRDTVKVLYVGRVSVEKNLPFLVGVWKQVFETLKRTPGAPDAELVVVGGGPYEKKMAEELRGKNVRFLGFKRGQELSTIYASSDMFLFPSVTDTLGQVVMESQSSGIPVIVTDQGGPKEVVDAGTTGYVLPADRPDLWAEHTVALITDHERRKAMGNAGYESMKPYSLSHSFEHFWQVHTEAWHDHLAATGIRKHASAHTPEKPGAAPAHQ
ncbi:MAG: glycosyltransferase [Planctomycetota bacterium]